MKYLIIMIAIMATFTANAEIDSFKDYPVAAPVYSNQWLGDEANTDAPVFIEIVTFGSQELLEAEWFRMTGDDSPIAAFSLPGRLSDGTRICRIYIISAAFLSWNNVQGQADIGHEIYHCFGAEHK